MKKYLITYDAQSGTIQAINTSIESPGSAQIELALPASQLDTVQLWRIDPNTRTFVLKNNQSQIQSDQILGRIRERRNALLTSTDWTQMPDVDLSAAQQAAWADYRHQLRHMTDNMPAVLTADYSVTWPPRPV